MKTSTKVGIFFAIMSVVMIVAGVVFASVNKATRTVQENIVIIKQVYTAFSVGVVENHQYRSELLGKLNSFSNETYSEMHDDFVKLLTNYGEKIKVITDNVNILEDKCSISYDDNQTNIFCANYRQLYEAVNNEYIANVARYNDKIKEYNLTAEESYTSFEAIRSEYIDFDGDGVYHGRG